MRITSPSRKSSVDLDDVRRKLEQLAAEDRVSDLIALVMELLVGLRDTNNALTVRLHNALRVLYGRKSQKVSPEQLLLLFAELGANAPAGAPETTGPAQGASPAGQGSVPQPPDRPKPVRRPGGRGPLAPHLPRREHIVPVPEAERVCAQCGEGKVCIGHKTSEILEFIPAQLVVIEEKREKLACPRCPEEGVSTAPSTKVMDRGRPGPGLIARLLVEKFQDAMPIERQADGFAREGVPLSPSTLGDWTSFGLDVLAPVAERIRERALESFYVNADDTGMPVQDHNHPKNIRRGHIWCFVGGGYPAFVYTPDWKSHHVAEVLEGFTGFLQGDGYAGYEAMTHPGRGRQVVVPEERMLGCGMHIRSNFEKAAVAGDARAAVVLVWFRDIYRIEAECKAEGLSPEARHARRLEQSLPIIDEMYRWIHEIHPTLVPKTSLQKATLYAVNQEAAWRRCFTDGRFEIDNGAAERQLRRVAIGRKNYLFAGSDKGGERLAVGYTVFAMCRMHDVNPFEWATDVIVKLQDGWPRSRLDELLPDVWAKARPPAAFIDDDAAS